MADKPKIQLTTYKTPSSFKEQAVNNLQDEATAAFDRATGDPEARRRVHKVITGFAIDIDSGLNNAALPPKSVAGLENIIGTADKATIKSRIFTGVLPKLDGIANFNLLTPEHAQICKESIGKALSDAVDTRDAAVRATKVTADAEPTPQPANKVPKNDQEQTKVAGLQPR